MNKIQETVQQIHELDNGTMGEESMLHPVAPLLVTFLYIAFTVSFHRYDLWGLLSMVLYPMMLGIVCDISIRKAVGKIWPVLLVVAAVGIANPFFDRQIMSYVGEVAITGGMISMLTLMMKGIFCVLASYMLIQMTGMRGICYGLRCLHVPREIVTILMLIYRYLILLLKEVDRMSQAYHLRAPEQRGIHLRHWGPFAGRLLLRSMDRAETVYESMLLRGYEGEFPMIGQEKSKAVSVTYTVGWLCMLMILRMVPVFLLVGGLL